MMFNETDLFDLLVAVVRLIRTLLLLDALERQWLIEPAKLAHTSAINEAI
jgi:hypothetical protein